MSTIAARLGVDANYASQYLLRQLAAELITPAGYGHVTFTLPYLREYLRGQSDIPTPGHPTLTLNSPHPALDRLHRSGRDPRNQWPGPPAPNQAPPR